jgi:lysophospholipase L1-like esterase
MRHTPLLRYLPVAAWLAAALLSTPASAATLKVACTGTSAMEGLGSTTGHHVPDELGRDLGAGFEVKNFAVDGTTAIASVSTSYAATPEMKAALAYNPDVVLFWFGGNDSFKGTWDAHKGEFKADYTSLVRAFQALPSHPKTLLVRLWVFVNTPVQQTVIDQEILPIIDQMAVDTNSTLIDYRKAFEMHPEYFPDGMHPNDTGTLAIGKLFADSVTSALLEMGTQDGGAPLDAGAGGSGGGADGGAFGVAGAASAVAGSAPVSGTSGAAGASTSAGVSAGAPGASGAASGGTSGSTPPVPAAPGGATAPGGNGASNGCSIGGADAPLSRSALLMMSVALALVRRRRRAA